MPSSVSRPIRFTFTLMHLTFKTLQCMKHNRTNNSNLTSKSKRTSCQVALASQHRSNTTKHSHKWLLATRVHSSARIADRRDSRQKPVLSHLHPRSDPDASLMRSRAASPTWGSDAHGPPIHTERASRTESWSLKDTETFSLPA